MMYILFSSSLSFKKKGVTKKWTPVGDNLETTYYVFVYEKSCEIFMQMTEFWESIY